MCILGISIRASRAQNIYCCIGAAGNANYLCRPQASREIEIRCAAFWHCNPDFRPVCRLHGLQLRPGSHKIGVVHHHVRRREVDLLCTCRIEGEKGYIPLLAAKAFPQRCRIGITNRLKGHSDPLRESFSKVHCDTTKLACLWIPRHQYLIGEDESHAELSGGGEIISGFRRYCWSRGATDKKCGKGNCVDQ